MFLFRETKRTRREGKKQNGDESPSVGSTPVKVTICLEELFVNFFYPCFDALFSQIHLPLLILIFCFYVVFTMKKNLFKNCVVFCCWTVNNARVTFLCFQASKPLPGDSPVKEEEEEDDDFWSVDTSAAAVRERQRDLTSAAASLAVNDDLELPVGQRLEKFFNFVQVLEQICYSRQSLIL